MRRDRWAQVALEGHSPPPAEIGALNVGPAMAGLRGWLFTRPLPLPRSQSPFPWGIIHWLLQVLCSPCPPGRWVLAGLCIPNIQPCLYSGKTL